MSVFLAMLAVMIIGTVAGWVYGRQDLRDQNKRR